MANKLFRISFQQNVIIHHTTFVFVELEVGDRILQGKYCKNIHFYYI